MIEELSSVQLCVLIMEFVRSSVIKKKQIYFKLVKYFKFIFNYFKAEMNK